MLVEWAADVTGVGKITRKRTSSEKHAPGLTYAVSNRQALAVLEQVMPYLRSYKKFRARLALDQYLAHTPRNGKYTIEQSTRRDHFERSFLDITPGGRPRRGVI